LEIHTLRATESSASAAVDAAADAWNSQGQSNASIPALTPTASAPAAQTAPEADSV